jgi:hypothetical protein
LGVAIIDVLIAVTIDGAFADAVDITVYATASARARGTATG